MRGRNGFVLAIIDGWGSMTVQYTSSICDEVHDDFLKSGRKKGLPWPPPNACQFQLQPVMVYAYPVLAAKFFGRSNEQRLMGNERCNGISHQPAGTLEVSEGDAAERGRGRRAAGRWRQMPWTLYRRMEACERHTATRLLLQRADRQTAFLRNKGHCHPQAQKLGFILDASVSSVIDLIYCISLRQVFVGLCWLIVFRAPASIN